MWKIFCVLRHFSAILFKFTNQSISLTLCSIHFWKALDVRINITLAFLLFGDFWKAQNFNDGAGLKWRLYLRVRLRCFLCLWVIESVPWSIRYDECSVCCATVPHSLPNMDKYWQHLRYDLIVGAGTGNKQTGLKT